MTVSNSFAAALSDAYKNYDPYSKNKIPHKILYQNIFSKKITTDLKQLPCYQRLLYWKMSTAQIIKLTGEAKTAGSLITPEFCNALYHIKVNKFSHLRNPEKGIVSKYINNKIRKEWRSLGTIYEEFTQILIAKGSIKPVATSPINKTNSIQQIHTLLQKLLSKTYDPNAKLLTQFAESIKNINDEAAFKELICKFKKENSPLQFILEEIALQTALNSMGDKEKTEVGSKLLEELVKLGLGISEMNGNSTPLIAVLGVLNYKIELHKMLISTLINLGAKIDVLPKEKLYVLFNCINKIDDFDIVYDLYPKLFELTDPDGRTFAGNTANSLYKFELLATLIKQDKVKLDDPVYRDSNKNPEKIIELLVKQVSNNGLMHLDKVEQRIRELITDESFYEFKFQNGKTLRENLQEAVAISTKKGFI